MAHSKGGNLHIITTLLYFFGCETGEIQFNEAVLYDVAVMTKI